MRSPDDRRPPAARSGTRLLVAMLVLAVVWAVLWYVVLHRTGGAGSVVAVALLLVGVIGRAMLDRGPRE